MGCWNCEGALELLRQTPHSFRGTGMNEPAKPERAAHDAVAAASTVEGEIRDVVRRDIKAARRRTAPAESTADHLNSLIERVAGMSMKEIDNLIAELQAVRNLVIAEGERVQREFTNYTQATQAARSSVKIITDATNGKIPLGPLAAKLLPPTISA